MSKMSLHEAKEFLDNMAGSEATQGGLSEGFAAQLHGYHYDALQIGIKCIEACEDMLKVYQQEKDITDKLDDTHEYRQTSMHDGAVWALQQIIDRHFQLQKAE